MDACGKEIKNVYEMWWGIFWDGYSLFTKYFHGVIQLLYEEK